MFRDGFLLVDRGIKIEIEEALDGLFNGQGHEEHERNREILRLRFYEGLKYREIGQMYEITPGRVRQIVMKGLRMLKHPSRSRKLRRYL